MRENVKQSDWAGLIPTEWKIAPLKSQFLFNKGLPITKADLIEEGLPVISYGQIHSKECIGTSLDERLLRYVDTEYSQSHPSSKTIKGDIIIADTSEDLDGCGNAVLNDKEYPVFAGYHTIVLKNVNINNSKYFAYLLRTDAWRSQIRKQLTEVKLFSITQKTLRQVEVLIPDIEIQNSIVNYLDNACSKIDEAISRHKQIIEKLEEYRKAVITKVVTKGLDPNVEMKDSVIRWARRIPAHWSSERLKYVAKITNGMDPKTEGNIPVYGSGATSFKTCGEFKKGPTVLIGRKGATLHIPHYIFNNYWNVDTAFDCHMRGNNDLRWFYYIAICLDYKYFLTQTTLPSMTQTDYCNMILPVPPIKEQTQIANYLDGICHNAEDAIYRHTRIIEILEKYRKSIIYNAVTGKIDCRDSKA